MAPNPSQPKRAIKETVATLAKVGRLKPFDDLRLIGQYAREFKKDPDEVFVSTIFSTFKSFHVMWKEEAEYQERFNAIWSEINSPPTLKKT